MFGIGLPELLFILALALIVLGPGKMPQVAKQLARMLMEIKRAANEFKTQLDLDEFADYDADEPRTKIQVGEKGQGRAPRGEALYVPPDLEQRTRAPGGLGPEWQEAKGQAAEARAESCTQGWQEDAVERRADFTDTGSDSSDSIDSSAPEVPTDQDHTSQASRKTNPDGVPR